MYGMVNRALQGYIVDEFGQTNWEEIKAKAGINNETFVSMQPYPDEITYNLAKAATEVLNISISATLEGFGEYWVTYTAKEEYGDILKLCGKTLPEFLQNLDFLHSRMGMSFPAYKPPSFKCADLKEHSLRLQYFSQRPGLSPMVIGLVRGLGKMFDTPVQICLSQAKRPGLDFDEFLVQF